MDSEFGVKRVLAWKDPTVLFMLSILLLSSPLLRVLLYFSPLILSTALMCAIALVNIVNPHETESELVDQINVGESHSTAESSNETTVSNFRRYATWLMGLDDRSADSVSSDNIIPSTSQMFDTLPAAGVPIDQFSPEYASSCDEENVEESESEDSELEEELDDFYEEEFSTEELEVCEDMATQTALDWNAELQKIVITAQSLIRASRKWLPALSCFTDRALASFKKKHSTEEKLTGDVYGVLLLRFQNISVRLHEDSEQQHIFKVEEDYKQKISLESELTTVDDQCCKLQSQSGQSHISLDSTICGLREKYNSDQESSLWMENFASSDEETASECSSDVDSFSLVDLDTTSTARNSTHFSESLKEEHSHQILEPAGRIICEAILSEEKSFRDASDDMICKEQEPNSHACDATMINKQEEIDKEVSRTASGDTVPAGIELEASKGEEAHDPLLSVLQKVTEEEEASAKDILALSQRTSIKSNRPVKSWPTVQEVLEITRTGESFPYVMRTGNSISSISNISNPAASSCMAIKIEL